MVDLGKTYRALCPILSSARLALAVTLLSLAMAPALHGNVRQQISPPAERKLPQFLQKNYYLLKITRSYPSEENRLDLDADGVGYGLGYTFVIRQKYLVSLVAGFHSLAYIPTDDSFGYFTIYNESLRLFRLYHPLYLTVGGRIGYAIPTEDNSLPLKQNKEFENEIMLGASAGLALVVSKSVLVGSHLAYWGGTNTSKHLVIDFALDLRVAL